MFLTGIRSLKFYRDFRNNYFESMDTFYSKFFKLFKKLSQIYILILIKIMKLVIFLNFSFILKMIKSLDLLETKY